MMWLKVGVKDSFGGHGKMLQVTSQLASGSCLHGASGMEATVPFGTWNLGITWVQLSLWTVKLVVECQYQDECDDYLVNGQQMWG